MNPIVCYNFGSGSLAQQGKGAEVYRTLLRFEAQHAGDAEFDYLLGIAALDAGQADKATLALERVVILKPAYLAARLDLALAYFALGDLDRARTEFEAVQRESPPPAAQATIERYLAAIAERRQTQGTRATGYLEAAMGRDTNVNAATRARMQACMTAKSSIRCCAMKPSGGTTFILLLILHGDSPIDF